jgi:hypothetical protein
MCIFNDKVAFGIRYWVFFQHIDKFRCFIGYLFVNLLSKQNKKYVSSRDSNSDERGTNRKWFRRNVSVEIFNVGLNELTFHT